jgi:hypothetical protein
MNDPFVLYFMKGIVVFLASSLSQSGDNIMPIVVYLPVLVLDGENLTILSVRESYPAANKSPAGWAR